MDFTYTSGNITQVDGAVHGSSKALHPLYEILHINSLTGKEELVCKTGMYRHSPDINAKSAGWYKLHLLFVM